MDSACGRGGAKQMGDKQGRRSEGVCVGKREKRGER